MKFIDEIDEGNQNFLIQFSCEVDGCNSQYKNVQFDDIKCTITPLFAYDDVIGRNLQIY